VRRSIRRVSLVRQCSDCNVILLKLIVFTSLHNKVTLQEDASKSYSRHLWCRNPGDTFIHDKKLVLCQVIWNTTVLNDAKRRYIH
jgi:hypothetical protein